jgi:8-oxo-dGTP pyrophosphatase MutT (NUDIX family)
MDLLTGSENASATLASTLGAALLDPELVSTLDVQGQIDAAVLVPLYVQNGSLHVVMTKRREDMRRHAGEISFPGGRQDEGESELRATALREAHEEIGLEPAAVQLIGALTPTPTFVTGYSIYPFVGLIEPGHIWTPSEREVAQVLEFPLPELRSSFARRRLVRRGIPFKTDTYVVGDHLIWGATARMLSELLERLPPPLAQNVAH